MTCTAKTEPDGQGLIIDTDTGRIVAVVYHGEDAALLAAAPGMRELLANAAEVIGDLRGRYDPKTPIESDIERTLASLNQ
jgi:hypothetical protein